MEATKVAKKEPVPLTRLQLRVLNYVKKYICEEQRPPTCAEIAAHFGWSSDNSAWLHLDALARKERIQLSRGSSRGIKVLGAKLKFVI